MSIHSYAFIDSRLDWINGRQNSGEATAFYVTYGLFSVIYSISHSKKLQLSEDSDLLQIMHPVHSMIANPDSEARSQSRDVKELHHQHHIMTSYH